MLAILNLYKNSIPHKILKIIRYNVLQRGFCGLTSPIRTLPDFIVIGAKRCGTTSLYHYLGLHPCIKRSSHDHLGFFDDNFRLGINWYKSYFPTVFTKYYVKSCEKYFMTYDVTATYIRRPWSATNILKTLPNIKLLVILRNPIDRAYSDYNDRENSRKTNITFEDTIKEEIKMLEKEANETGSREYDASIMQKSVLAKGFYADQLKTWFNLFPKENILILLTEDFSINPNKTFEEISNFLKLPNYNIKNFEKKNVGKYQKMNPETRKFLINYYKPYNEQLYKIVEKNFNWDK